MLAGLFDWKKKELNVDDEFAVVLVAIFRLAKSMDCLY
jgi:hypothetical protein